MAEERINKFKVLSLLRRVEVAGECAPQGDQEYSLCNIFFLDARKTFSNFRGPSNRKEKGEFYFLQTFFLFLGDAVTLSAPCRTEHTDTKNEIPDRKKKKKRVAVYNTRVWEG